MSQNSVSIDELFDAINEVNVCPSGEKNSSRTPNRKGGNRAVNDTGGHNQEQQTFSRGYRGKNRNAGDSRGPHASSKRNDVGTSKSFNSPSMDNGKRDSVNQKRHVKSGPRNEQCTQNFDPESSKGNQRLENIGRKKKGFSKYKVLETLVDKEPHEIVTILQNPTSGFWEMLDDDIKPHHLLRIIKAIHLVCESDFKECKAEILGRLGNSQFMKHLDTYLGNIVTETNKRTLSCVEEFTKHLVIFYKTTVDMIPRTAYNRDFEKIIKKTIITVDNIRLYLCINIDAKCSTDLNDILQSLQEYKEEEIEPVGKRRDRNMAYVDPPDDFRTLSLYPTLEDVSRRGRGFIRPNIVEGAYTGVEHYLDVQFRLLREDFMSPLCCGIKKYLENRASKGRMKFKQDNVRFYPDTQFVSHYCKDSKVGFMVQFSKKTLKIKWEYSKRFMFGSLLLFTEDDFGSFFLATVANRNVDDLNRNMVAISLVGDMTLSDEIFKKKFLMAESEVYFEPYFRVMKALQEFNDTNFPMERYIVKGETDSKLPQYITPNLMWSIKARKFLVHELARYLSADFLGFDEYQYKAFCAALTREFVVIQGPPGTGKTFIGLKIVETFLKNQVLTGTQLFPILLVCYTNHALDQFLEGILSYTENIIRIGGQSKSEKLKPYNLRGKNHRQLMRHSRDMFQALKEVHREATQTYLMLGKIQAAVASLSQYEGVINLASLKSVMGSYYSKHFADEEKFMDWLVRDALIDENVETDEINDEEPQSTDQKEATNVETTFEAEDDLEDEEENPLDLNLQDDLYDQNLKKDALNLKKGADPVHVNYYVHLSALKNDIKDLESQLSKMKKKKRKFLDDANALMEYEEIRYRLMEDKKIHNFLMNKLHSPEVRKSVIEGPVRQVDLRAMPMAQRWLLYGSWVNKLKHNLMVDFKKYEELHRKKFREYEELKQLEDLAVVKHAHVVGITTTGTARLQTMLRALKPKIVVIEEAAEVLESHVVVSLTKDCQHVILIGDHKQLRPSTAVYELSKRYNFDISLFERMVKNGMDCPQLNVQHRMRPEISALIAPYIYPNLKNDPSVSMFESIKGITKNLFFVNHNVPEEQVEESSSRKNLHEAEFMIQLCRYLILQGYKGSQITILTTYTGQMFELRGKKKLNSLLKEVRMIVVDKYQGEENDIILLSLVRSNEEGKIGFLKTENRVCVALSRAKMGLYIIGNMENLTRESNMWKNIKTSLETQSAVGSHLTLECQIHLKRTMVAKNDDFIKVQEGGCDMMCGMLLGCGHNCKQLCHMLDRDHNSYKCKEKCPRTCNYNHPCSLKCHEPCRPCMTPIERELRCGHTHMLACHVDTETYKCPTPILETLPCSHTVEKQCYISVGDFRCPRPCENRLDCGHACTRNCHIFDDPEHVEYKCQKRCERKNDSCKFEHRCNRLCFEDCGKCTVYVEQQLPCGHIKKLPCSIDIERFECLEKCARIIQPCGHKCRKLCKDDCAPCLTLVEKRIPACGHTLTVECGVEPKLAMCRERCERILPCFHKCRGKCAEPCNELNCEELIKSPVVPICGHSEAQVRCNQWFIAKSWKPDNEELLQHCPKKCDVILKCGDPCSGTCSECWQGRLHKTCQQKCGNVLICGHSCKFPCRDICPPCREKCTYKCEHSKCPRKCGVPCAKCKEPCTWECQHKKCTRTCGAICDRDPCYEPCPKKLECGHMCIGFCGEPCPPLCRICNEEEVTTIFLGYEDEPDARFVLLVDCNHTIESRGLEMSLKVMPGGGEITMKVCPVCKTPIVRTLRFMKYVKQTYEDILKVKKTIFGNAETIKGSIHALVGRLGDCKLDFLSLCLHLQVLHSQICDTLNNFTEKKCPINQGQLKAMRYIVEVFIIPLVTKKEDITPDMQPVLSRIDLISDRLLKCEYSLSEQHIEDLTNEIRRLHRLVDLEVMARMSEYRASKSSSNASNVYQTLHDMVYGIEIFTEERDKKFGDIFIELKNAMRYVVTDEERRQVHLAMAKDFLGGSRSQGRWFKCPKGHIYCVTECGYATQSARCPMDGCGEMIGQNYMHQLASEMGNF